uniref:Uncharacterized protein n=1 Tax=Globodera rostochiensis TaxID=31243 RepID=A0A914HPY9_GLORO
MEEFWVLILVSFFATNLLDKSESVKLELKTFDEIFGEGWWDKGEAEDLKTPAPTNFGQNVHHQIDRQNTQIGQIEPNSTDQNPPLTEWKSDLGQTKPQHKYSHSEQKELMKRYYEIKDQSPKISDEDIAKMLKIGTSTLLRWKKQFKQHFHPNFVNGHSGEENAAVNVQEIGNSNLGSI